jgi:two-component system, NtrC family, sensor kinase
VLDPIFENYITLIKAKPEETQQTFTNLRMNGVQAIEVKGRIEDLSSRENENVIEIIKDIALGIAKEYLQKIHDPFFTTKDQVTGTILVLNIVRPLVVKEGIKLMYPLKKEVRRHSP